MSLQTSSSRALIQGALKRWHGTLSDDVRALFPAFVDETISRLRGPFLAQHSPGQVLAYLEQALKFTSQRGVDEVKIQLDPQRTKGLTTWVNLNDQSFIVDTVRLFLKSHSAAYWGGFNITFRATRDEKGKLISVGDEGAALESLVMLESDTGALIDDLQGAANQLQLNLFLARAMVRDFRPMTRSVERFVERCEDLGDKRPDQADALRETGLFLKWLLKENFVFMGVDSGEPMGFQTVEGDYLGSPDGEWAQPHFPQTVRVRKSNLESPVHRSGRIDEILVTVGADDDPHAMRLFIRGMFTYRAVTQPSRHVPILRGVLADILSEEASGPGTYRYKGIANVFDSLPTEFLFTATRKSIQEMVELVFEAEQQQDVGVTFLMNGQQSAFCLVAMPKSRFGDELRRQLEGEIVSRLSATYSDHGLFIGRYETVLLHYYLTGVDDPGGEAVSALTERIRALATPWQARLWAALVAEYDEPRADRLAETYGRAFPESFMRSTPAGRAVRDIALLERLAGKRVLADVYEDEADGLVLRVYQKDDVNLSELLPVLDDFGLVAASSFATEVKSRGGTLHLDTFHIEGAKGVTREQLLERVPLLTDAVDAVFGGAVADDRLNGLTLRAGLSWQEVDMLRGYISYMRQLPVKISASRMVDIVLQHPMMVGSLVNLFKARFDPDLEADREAAILWGNEVVTDELRYILSHDEDLAFSSLRTLIQGTTRTNYYRTDRKFHYLSFKLDAASLELLGEGRPMYEIYVHNRLIEGVHLRYGPVARGGLRWSDRDDFRTEILGLATTQQVKNVVIVPTGSKGGFYLKHPSIDRAERRKEADHHYKTLIRGMLDLTDNNVDGTIVPPPRVVRHDGDDPYLVVAADKGTAHLSDTANGVSREYGFWLDDAFASGGSNGYDHKVCGITARGAWVLVRRHFAEMGRNPYEEPFTVVGIGDMGGDVFGNGLIESKQTRLLAAFNHMHIFLDPNPDPATTWVERDRLFKTQGGWDKYDQSLISEGGGVFDRRAKSMELSPQIQEMLGLSVAEARPEEVIHHILRMEVDLLWNGGIGTYVKASFETHADADDRGNDDLRINATQMRAKIVGEGGNLGMTAKARIEAGLRGVRLNTDFIDNSGGVDMSDHEVNLKILVNQLVARGELTVDQRNQLLEDMTDEVAAHVLADNDAHGRQLSRDQIRSKQNIFGFGRAIAFVEREFNRSRTSLFLPSVDELERRAREGLGLSRPELAMLSAWVKMFVYRELLAGSPRDLPGYDQLLRTYFPKRIQTDYPDDIPNHMLADEIAMTVATSKMVADSGAAFFPMIIEATGAGVPEIAGAYLKAQAIAETTEIRGTLEELRTSVSLEALYGAWVEVDAGVREVALYWLSAQGRIPTDDEIEKMTTASTRVSELQAKDVLARNQASFDLLRSDDIPQEVATRVVRSKYLNIALMVWAEAQRADLQFEQVAVRHLAIGRASRLQEVLDDLASRPASGRWDPIALRILHARFHQLLRSLVAVCPDGLTATVDELEAEFTDGALDDVRGQVDDLLGGEQRPNIATLLVLEERVAAAIARLRL